MIVILNGADFSQNNIGQVEIPLVLDNDVKNYLTKVLVAEPNFNYDKYARPLNNFIINMKEAGLYSKMYHLNLYVGTTKQSQMIPVIDVDNVGMNIYDSQVCPMVFSNNGAKRNNTKPRTESKYSDWSWFGFNIPVSFYNNKDNGGCVIIGTTRGDHSPLGGNSSSVSGMPCIAATSESTPSNLKYGKIGIKNTNNGAKGVICKGDNNRLFATNYINGETRATVDSTFMTDVIYDDGISSSCVGKHFNINGFGNVNLFVNGNFNTDYSNISIGGADECVNNEVFFSSCGAGLTQQELATLSNLVRQYNATIGRTNYV